MEVLDNIVCESAPLADSHLANKAYVDAAVAGNGTASVSGDNIVSIPAHSLISCGLAPTEGPHLANKAYVDAAVAAAGTATPIEEPAGLGKVVYVTTLSDAATHSGTSLRDAIAAVTAWGTVVIKFSVSGTITLEQGEISLPGRIVIDGEDKITISGGNVSRLFVIDAKTVLDLRRLTITGGNGVGAVNSQTYGGAIYFNGAGVLHARDVTFTENHLSGTAANVGGGAIGMSSVGRCYLKNCTFSNNSAVTTGQTAQGGAIQGTTYTLEAEDCTFSGNSVTGGSYGYGGAVSSPGLILRRCVFNGNYSDNSPSRRYGGAIYSTNSVAYISDCEFKNNSVTAQASGCMGGAIYANVSQILHLEDCTFSGNTGYYGAAFSNYGSVTGTYDNCISRCVFEGNIVSTSGRGAALYLYYCDAAIEDCEFKNHSVGGASGVVYAYGYTGKLFDVTINRCKFTGNSASAATTGLVYCANLAQVYLYNTVFTANSFTATSGNHKCVYTTGSSWAYIYNCTFTNNTAKGGAFYAAAGGVDIYNSVEYGNGSASGKGTNATVNAAKFLSDQSASVGRDIAYDSTKPLFESDGFTPAANSQVIGKGLAAHVMTEYDLNGKTRVSGAAVDLGAVEYQGA
ncbi:MAG: hypothetical protein IK105_09265 [Thermoguttaceae bacterium]|nr:hypothetical protein [Thermoguttaceae bacterium]